MNLIHRDQYSEIWRQENIPLGIIKLSVERYEYLPSDLVYKMVTDDVLAGVPPLNIPYTSAAVALHDKCFLMKKAGYPISDNLETNLDLLVRETGQVAKNILLAPVMLGVGVIGSVGGILYWYFN